MTSTSLELAQRLLDYEAAAGEPSTASADAALRVCEKLRRSLSELTGVVGFRSLFARALTLTKAEVPWLDATLVNDAGVLVGLESIDPELNQKEVARGVVVLVAYLIGLLVAFVGEGLTLRLLRDVFPEANVFAKGETEENHEQTS